MAVIVKNLASGSITSITAKVLGPLSGKAWIVKSVMLTNKDTGAVPLDVKVTGTSPNTVAYVAPPSMSLAAKGTVVLNDEITLQFPPSGTQETLSIAAVTAPATGIDYVLNGVERDIA